MARPNKNQKLSPLSISGATKLTVAEIVQKKTQANILKTMRKAKGYTLSDLSQLTGLSPSYISRLEIGDRRYNADILEKLSAVLGCNPSDLLDRKENFADELPKDSALPTLKKDFPIYKTIPGKAVKDNEYSFISFDESVHRIFRLPQLLGNSSAFAFYIVDDMNEAKYVKGDLVFVNTEKTVARNMPIALLTLDSKIIVGKLIDWDDFVVKISHYGKNEIKEFKKSDLNGIYSILGSFDQYEII